MLEHVKTKTVCCEHAVNACQCCHMPPAVMEVASFHWMSRAPGRCCIRLASCITVGIWIELGDGVRAVNVFA